MKDGNLFEWPLNKDKKRNAICQQHIETENMNLYKFVRFSTSNMIYGFFVQTKMLEGFFIILRF